MFLKYLCYKIISLLVPICGKVKKTFINKKTFFSDFFFIILRIKNNLKKKRIKNV